MSAAPTIAVADPPPRPDAGTVRTPRQRAIDAVVRTLNGTPEPTTEQFEEVLRAAVEARPDKHPMDSLRVECARLIAVLAMYIGEEQASRDAKRAQDARDAAPALPELPAQDAPPQLPAPEPAP